MEEKEIEKYSQEVNPVVEKFRVPIVETRLHWKKRSFQSERIDTVSKAAQLGKKLLPRYLDREYVYVVACTAKMEPIALQLVSVGTMSVSLFGPARILAFLLLSSAHSFVIYHNHISGDTTPSQDDINATKRMKEAANIVGLHMVDHLIIGDGYTSMKEKGYL